MYLPGWLVLYVAVALAGSAVWIAVLQWRLKRGDKG